MNSVTIVEFVGADPEQRQARNNGSKFTVLPVEEGLLPSRADPPSDYPEELIAEAKTWARMSTLQRDELWTQSKILEEETSPLAKEANQYSEAEPCKTKHSQDL
jgi:hypothetical protein